MHRSGLREREGSSEGTRREDLVVSRRALPPARRVAAQGRRGGHELLLQQSVSLPPRHQNGGQGEFLSMFLCLPHLPGSPSLCRCLSCVIAVSLPLSLCLSPPFPDSPSLCCSLSCRRSLSLPRLSLFLCLPLFVAIHFSIAVSLGWVVAVPPCFTDLLVFCLILTLSRSTSLSLNVTQFTTLRTVRPPLTPSPLASPV